MNPRHHHPQTELTAEDREFAAKAGEWMRETQERINRSKEMIELRERVADLAVRAYVGAQGAVSLQQTLDTIFNFIRAPFDEAFKDKGR